jgi:hypothetical protein
MLGPGLTSHVLVRVLTFDVKGNSAGQSHIRFSLDRGTSDEMKVILFAQFRLMVQHKPEHHTFCTQTILGQTQYRIYVIDVVQFRSNGYMFVVYRPHQASHF